MDNKRNDRRTNRTRRQLREAFFALILEKGYDAVTIEDITERADLGRTTFYLHYKDKEELLLESIDAMVNGLVDYIYQIPSPAETNPNEGFRAAGLIRTSIQRVFEHAAENANLYIIILRGEGGSKMATRLRHTVGRAVIDFYQARSQQESWPESSQFSLDFFSNYVAGALLNTVTWWLEHEMPEKPERMADTFTGMLLSGVRYLFEDHTVEKISGETGLPS